LYGKSRKWNIFYRKITEIKSVCIFVIAVIFACFDEKIEFYAVEFKYVCKYILRSGNNTSP